MKANRIPGGMPAQEWGRLSLREQLDVMLADYDTIKGLIAEADAKCVELRKAYEGRRDAADAIRDRKARAAARRAVTISRVHLEEAEDNSGELYDWWHEMEDMIITTKANIVAGVISDAELCISESCTIELGDYGRAFYDAIDEGDSMRILACARGLAREVADASTRMVAEGDALESKGLVGDRYMSASDALDKAYALICDMFKI